MNVEKMAYRVTEVAESLGCSRDTIDRLINSGQLKAFRIKSSKFVSVEELRRFIHDREEAEK